MNGSRRESRSSLGNRQNDALFEFENFKKKFLLANKHIAKLNSTLSIRIEELNAQISMLYVENLRLRASEIALASQLKREREESRKILVDAEAASQRLTKHLSYLRESLHDKDEPAAPPTPPSPKARRPPVNLNFNLDPLSPQFRIARPPNIPGIYEDEEPCASTIGEPETITTAPPRKKPKTKTKASGSRLPLPAPPTLPLTEDVSSKRLDLSNMDSSVKPRKTIRRQSGLLKVATESLAVPRSGSPAFGSPIRLEAGLAEEEEEIAAIHGEFEILVLEQQDRVGIVINNDKDKDKRKGKPKEQPDSEKQRPRNDEPGAAGVKRSKSRSALQPIDNNVEEAIDTETKSTSQRQFLRPPSPSRDSSSPAPSEQVDGVAGREKRVRKSVNYAEPKLNTKMRKPDPQPGTEPPRKKRSSAAAVMSTSSQKPASSSSTATDDIVVLAGDAEKRTTQEDPLSQPVFPLRGANGNYIDPENFMIPSSRPGSAAAMYSPGPPTRTTGSTTSSSSTSAAPSSSSVVSTDGIKRPKSRPQLPFSEDDSDGAEADAEYLGSGHTSSGSNSGWGNVNMESGRRRGVPKRSAAAAAVMALEDIRRHSMAL